MEERTFFGLLIFRECRNPCWTVFSLPLQNKDLNISLQQPPTLLPDIKVPQNIEESRLPLNWQARCQVVFMMGK